MMSAGRSASWVYRRGRTIRAGLTLLVLMGILAGAAWYGWQSVLDADASGPTVVCSSPTPGQTLKITAGDVTVNVYNAGTTAGLAERTAADLEAQGFLVDEIANAPADFSDITRAQVSGRSEDAPEVLIVARQFKREVVVADDRSDPTVDLIIGDDFGGVLEDAPTAIEVESSTPICRTTTPSPVG